MPTITVATPQNPTNGVYTSKVELEYSFSKNTSNRTWSLSASLKFTVPSGWYYGPWANTGAFSGNLVIGGIAQLSAGTHTLATFSTNGNYNENGDAPSVNLSWAFNVNSPWGGFVNPHGTQLVRGDSIAPVTPSAPASVSISSNNAGTTDSIYYGLGETITISWSAASGTKTRYDVQRKIGSGSWTTIASPSSSTTSKTDTLTDTTIMPGTTVQYRVRAANGDYPSSYTTSNSLTVVGGVKVKHGGVWSLGAVWRKSGGAWHRAKRVLVKDTTWKLSK